MNDPDMPPAPEPIPAPPAPPAETPAERAEKAAIRRRWISLAEWVGIAALLISAVGLWMTWSDRKADQAERASESAEKSLVTFTALRSGGGAVLNLSDPDHRISEIDVTFPPALGAESQAGLSSPQINAQWFDKALLKATDKGKDDREGRLPVLITARWWDGDARKTDRAIYQVRWKTAGRLFRGRTVSLEGASLAERGGTPARLDALWTKERPSR
ncbi:MAG: hypothetical protein ACTHJR_03475 [Sphingomonas sp.]|uniref:hypothetical protein n=1 Tax=Sphingomonas sp. TaxID=28214 RepID=UPI003F7E724D